MLRKKMLIWKISHIETGLEPIQSGLEARDQELYEDYLRVMSGTKYEMRGKKTVEYFVRQRHERIWNSLEARIFRLLLQVKKENNVFFLDLFTAIFDRTEIAVESDSKGSCVDRETGERISANTLAKMLEEKFQGKKMVKKEFYEEDGVKKQKRITYYAFDEKTLSELARKYNIESNSVEQN